jgi:hypothetical protein
MSTSGTGSPEPTAATTTAPTKPRRIAPLWHTILLAVLLLGVSLGAANSQRTFVEHRGRIPLYASTMVIEWLVVGYVWWGVRKRGVTLRELTGGRWARPEDALLDVAIALGFWFVALGVMAAIGLLAGLATGSLGGGAAANAARLAQRCAELKRTVGFLAPAGRTEILLFLALSATAGFCEEIIYRGYFQRQLAAFSGLTFVGILGQAVLFGASHGYEGGSRMALIGVFAVLFGGLAWWRKSLRPGMMAHALHDSVTGLVLRPLIRFMNC